MLISCILLAISVSIDALGIGITYGLKNTKISILSKIILCLLSLFFTSISTTIGTQLLYVLPHFYVQIVGCLILVIIGAWIIHQAISSPSVSYDIDHSKKIDWQEAILLGIALSIDSIGVGIGSSLLGINTLLFPILVASFQLLFLSLGKSISTRVVQLSNVAENTWSIISGSILIFMGILKLL